MRKWMAIVGAGLLLGLAGCPPDRNKQSQPHTGQSGSSAAAGGTGSSSGSSATSPSTPGSPSGAVRSGRSGVAAGSQTGTSR